MKRNTLLILVAALLMIACVALVACNTTGQEDNPFKNPGDNLGGGGTGTLPDEVAPIEDDTFSFSDFGSLKDDVTSSSATTYTGSNTLLEISTAGDYVLSGTYANGVSITASKSEVHIFLDNATINNQEGIALSTGKNAIVTITALKNTTNTISGAGNAIHVKGTLDINGSGTINVASTGKNGIKVSKALSIVDTNVTIDSANHGISAQSVEAQDATITVTAAVKDGINAECDDDTTSFPEDYSEGFVALKNTAYTCNVQGDGIQADTLVYINGGNINITTQGEFIAYSSANLTEYDLVSDDFRYLKSGSTYKKIASDDHSSLSSRYALKQSCKGIKVGEIDYTDENENEITITDGDYLISINGNCVININSTDDAIHTNSGDVAIFNGNITINTLDDGITSDNHTQIKGGNIDIQSSYEGIEGAYVTITNGTINIVASDDGINAASDDRTIKEYISISGGNITVNASGDGIDSNGSILISGGTVIVHGPTTGRDAGLDADSGIIIQGGTVFASSTLGMVETPSQNSTQCVLSYAHSSKIESGSTIQIKDENDNVLFSVTTQEVCQSTIISLASFEKGKTYYIYGNGTKLTSFTISSTITSVGTSTSMGKPGGGPGGPGGGKR